MSSASDNIDTDVLSFRKFVERWQNISLYFRQMSSIASHFPEMSLFPLELPKYLARGHLDFY